MKKSVGSAIAMMMIASLTAEIGADDVRARTLEFSGHTWEARRSDGLEGPGPNRFASNTRTVWLDESGQLHLRVWSRLGAWFCAEVILTESLGYGTYIFETVGEIGSMDPPVILGMFTFDEDPEYAHREIDIEFGLFGAEEGDNAQFVIQPHTAPENVHRFSAVLEGTHLTHLFTWSPDQIRFATYHGHRADELRTVGTDAIGESFTARQWVYTGQVPPPGREQVRINLWLYRSAPPSRDHEVTVSSFSFLPLE